MSDQTNSRVKLLERTLRKKPQDVHTLSELALLLANQGDYSSASQHYETITGIDSENEKAWTALGHCHLLREDFSQSFAAYQHAMSATNEVSDPQLWYGVGVLFAQFGCEEYAESAYQSALSISSDDQQKSEILLKLGLTREKAAKFPQAVADYRESLKLKSTPLKQKVSVLCRLGWCCEQMNHNQEALAAYSEAFTLANSSVKVRKRLGWALYLTGNFDRAITILEGGLQFASGNTHEQEHLNYIIGLCNAKQGSFPEAHSALQQAIDRNSDVWMYWCSIGIVYGSAEQPEDAFHCLTKASELSQDSAEVLYNLGVLHELYEQFEEALVAYQRALVADSHNQAAAQRRSILLSGQPAESKPEFIYPVPSFLTEPASLNHTMHLKEVIKFTPVVDPPIIQTKQPKSVDPKRTELLPRVNEVKPPEESTPRYSVLRFTCTFPNFKDDRVRSGEFEHKRVLGAVNSFLQSRSEPVSYPGPPNRTLTPPQLLQPMQRPREQSHDRLNSTNKHQRKSPTISKQGVSDQVLLQQQEPVRKMLLKSQSSNNQEFRKTRRTSASSSSPLAPKLNEHSHSLGSILPYNLKAPVTSHFTERVVKPQQYCSELPSTQGTPTVEKLPTDLLAPIHKQHDHPSIADLMNSPTPYAQPHHVPGLGERASPFGQINIMDPTIATWTDPNSLFPSRNLQDTFPTKRWGSSDLNWPTKPRKN